MARHPKPDPGADEGLPRGKRRPGRPKKEHPVTKKHQAEEPQAGQQDQGQQPQPANPPPQQPAGGGAPPVQSQAQRQAAANAQTGQQANPQQYQQLQQALAAHGFSIADLLRIASSAEGAALLKALIAFVNSIGGGGAGAAPRA